MRAATRGWRAGIDTGGTFTDVVLEGPGGERWTAKVPSTPAAPADAVLHGLERVMEAADPDAVPGDSAGSSGRLPPVPVPTVVHGSTVATNAVLERRGARTALVTTAGFEDLLVIGRQARPDLYALEPRRIPPLAEAVIGLAERVDASGAVVRSLDPEEVRRVARDLRARGTESVAVCLLHSYAHPRHERAAAAALRAERLDTSLSSALVGEYREVERAWTTVANAYVAPVMRAYLRSLARRLPGLRIMLSSGGTASAAAAVREPVRTLLSGPAGGLLGARAAATRAGSRAFVALDMGGTSTDVSVAGDDAPTTSQLELQEMTLRTPVLDIHTVGAGGGSVARVDEGGALRVGPRSAGAEPGPACYGRGGTEPTVTDANLVLGRLPRVLGSGLELDADAARRALTELGARMGGRGAEAAALGVLEIAIAVMARAVRTRTVARGLDPRDHDLVAFGGAGPMHGAELAEGLGIGRVIVPADAGTLSAEGMLGAPAVRDLARTVLLPATAAGLERARRTARRLGEQATGELRREGLGRARMELSADLRYVGQSHELNVPLRGTARAHFERAYGARYGAPLAGREIEVVTVRARARVDARRGSGTGGTRMDAHRSPGTGGVRLDEPGERGTGGVPKGGRRRRDLTPSAPIAAGAMPAEAGADTGPGRPDGASPTIRYVDACGSTSAPVLHPSAVDAWTEGPTIVSELSATTVVPRGWRVRRADWGGLLLERVGSSRRGRDACAARHGGSLREWARETDDLRSALAPGQPAWVPERDRPEGVYLDSRLMGPLRSRDPSIAGWRPSGASVPP